MPYLWQLLKGIKHWKILIDRLLFSETNFKMKIVKILRSRGRKKLLLLRRSSVYVFICMIYEIKLEYKHHSLFCFIRNSESIEITDTKNSVTYELNVNPMCNVFPTVVSCTIKTFSVVQGAADTKNNICILGRNILNQQIFLVLWVWFMILFSATVCQIIYRLITLCVPSYQSWTIQYQLKSTDDLAVKKIELGFGNLKSWLFYLIKWIVSQDSKLYRGPKKPLCPPFLGYNLPFLWI